MSLNSEYSYINNPSKLEISIKNHKARVNYARNMGKEYESKKD